MLFMIFTSRNQLFKKKSQKKSSILYLSIYFPYLVLFSPFHSFLLRCFFPSVFFPLPQHDVLLLGQGWIEGFFLCASVLSHSELGRIILVDQEFFFISELESYFSIFFIYPKIFLKRQPSFKSSFFIGNIHSFSEFLRACYYILH